MSRSAVTTLASWRRPLALRLAGGGAHSWRCTQQRAIFSALPSIAASVAKAAASSLQSTSSPALKSSSSSSSSNTSTSSTSSSSHGARKRFSESRVLPYSQEQLYNVVADVASYHKFIPWCVGSEVVSRSARPEQVVLDVERDLFRQQQQHHHHHRQRHTQQQHQQHQQQHQHTQQHLHQHHVQQHQQPNSAPRRTATAMRQIIAGRLDVGFGPAKVGGSYVSNVICDAPWRVVASSPTDSSVFKHMETVWAFEPLPQPQPQPSTSASAITSASKPTSSSASASASGGAHQPQQRCRVHFTIDFEFHSAWHTAAASMFFDAAAQAMIGAFAGRCREIYGARPHSVATAASHHKLRV